MYLQNKMPPKVQARAEGVFQYSLPFDLDGLSVDDFQSIGIQLPDNLRGAIKKRQVEFLAGRYCVRLCFESFGLASVPEITSHEDRSPAWPEGWVGSISHARSLATAVLARNTTLAGVGIDIEQIIEKPTPQLAQHICYDDAELEQVMDRLKLPRDLALTLIFSSKESLYKALYPRLKIFFGFHAAALRVLDDGSLMVQLLNDLGDLFQRGQAWNVRYRLINEGSLETLLMDWA